MFAPGALHPGKPVVHGENAIAVVLEDALWIARISSWSSTMRTVLGVDCDSVVNVTSGGEQPGSGPSISNARKRLRNTEMN